MLGLSQAMEMATKAANKEMRKSQTRQRKVTFTNEPTSPTMTNDPFRIFILGPRVECRLPSFVWEQLSATFPGVPFRLYFVGPEAVPPQTVMSTQVDAAPSHRSALPMARVRHRSIDATGGSSIQALTVPVTINLRMEYIAAPFENVCDSFGPFQRRRDIFVLFNSGVGHSFTSEEWKPALHAALKTRCLMLFTSVNKEDQDADVNALQKECDGEYVVVMRPTENKFASMRPDIPVDSAQNEENWVHCNWGIFGIHGIGKEVGEQRDDFTVAPRPTSWWSW